MTMVNSGLDFIIFNILHPPLFYFRIRHCGSHIVPNLTGTVWQAPTTIWRGPGVVVNTAVFHAKVQGSVPGLGGLKETKNVSSPSTRKTQYCGQPP